ncbi:DUF1298 domain-containing protein [Burkholderiaceae bacterium DAT-1]|nr:DUF1298 domain-containing protein [Burkholderiaceae bacterium DAT-1]
MTIESNMSRRDFAWFRMDEQRNLMVINSILMFEGELDFARLKATIRKRLPNYPRFIQRIQTRWGRPQWVAAESFDIDQHVVMHDDDSHHDRRRLEAWMEQVAMDALPADRPLWHMRVFPRAGQGYAIVFRLHHCITDGAGLVHVLKHLTDDRQDHGHEPSLEWHPMYTQPSKTTPAGTFMFWSRILGQLGKLTALLPDKVSPLKRSLSGDKAMVWLPPMDIEFVRTISRRMGVTINDVWVAAVTCALRTWMSEQGMPVDGKALRGAVTFNLRNKADAFLLGNHFGLVAVDLPTNRQTPRQRLREVNQRMAAIKASHQPHATMFFLSLMGCLPRMLQSLVLKIFTMKASVVVTNVEGPDKVRYLAGSRMSDVICWVPQSGTLGTGFAVITYAGQVQMSVFADRNQVADAERLMSLIHEAMYKLERDTWQPDVQPGMAPEPLTMPLPEPVRVTG